jgi:predicted Zn-dependent protease
MLVALLSLLFVVFGATGTLDSKICELFTKRDMISLDNLLSEITVDKNLVKSDCSRIAVGVWFYNMGNYGEAEDWLRSVSSPSFMQVVNLSAVLIKENRLKEAEKLLKMAIVEYGEKKELMFNLAIVYVKNKNFRLARHYLIKILNSAEISDSLKSKALDILNLIGY